MMIDQDDASLTVVASYEEDFEDTESVTEMEEYGTEHPDDECDTDSMTAVVPIDLDSDEELEVAASERHSNDFVTAEPWLPENDEGDHDHEDDSDSVTAIASFEQPEEAEQTDIPVQFPRSERRQSTGFSRKSSLFLSRDSAATKDGVLVANQAKLPSESQAQRRGFDLDLDQAWQRSLLKELDRLDLDGEVVQSNKGKPEVMMLRHTESRDLAVEVGDDEFSLGTNASSTVPTKNQSIHRPPRGAVRTLESQQRGKEVTTGVEDNRDEFSHERQTDAGQESNKDKAGSKTTSLANTEKMQAGRKKSNLSLAKSLGDKRYSSDIHMTTDDGEPYMPVPNPACFCLGPNVFDYLIPPSTPDFRRRRMSRRSSKLGDIIEDALETMDKTDDKLNMPARSSIRRVSRGLIAP